MTKSLFKALICLIVLSSCGSSKSTQLVSHWKDPNLKEADIKELKSVMVAVFAANESSRRAAEDKIAEINPAIVQSYMILNEKISQSVEESKKIMEEKDFDGVLVFRLVSKEKSQEYVPGTSSYGGGYGGGYYGYHSGYYGSYYDPGYYKDNTSYVVETSLYSLKKDKLIWSGITSTVNPVSVKSAMSEIAETIFNQIQKDIEISKEQ